MKFFGKGITPNSAPLGNYFIYKNTKQNGGKTYSFCCAAFNAASRLLKIKKTCFRPVGSDSLPLQLLFPTPVKMRLNTVASVN